VSARNSPAARVTFVSASTDPFTESSRAYVAGASVRFARAPRNGTATPLTRRFPVLTFPVETRSVEVPPGPYNADNTPLPLVACAFNPPEALSGANPTITFDIDSAVLLPWFHPARTAWRLWPFQTERLRFMSELTVVCESPPPGPLRSHSASKKPPAGVYWNPSTRNPSLTPTEVNGNVRLS
jgi:hypothetical protein